MPSRKLSSRVPISAGVVAGIAAWLVGYVCTYIVAGTQIRESILSQAVELLGDGSATYKFVGWVFFNSHFVDTVVSGPLSTSASNAVGGGNGFTPILFLVPLALLVGAGLAVGRFQGVETAEAGAVAGLAVLPGYLVFAVLGTVLFEVSAGPASGGPDVVLAVVLAGVVYPAVFGALGGALAGETGG